MDPIHNRLPVVDPLETIAATYDRLGHTMKIDQGIDIFHF